MNRSRTKTLIVGLLIGLTAGSTATFFLKARGDKQHTQPVSESSATNSAASKRSRKILYYRGPMNPKQTSPVPRHDEMGMDFVPVYEDEAAGETPVSGYATVHIDPERQQLIGLTTARVTRGPIGGNIRTVGRVAVDETRVRHINVKVGGFVEAIFVDFVGKPVVKGQPLFSFYSPDLVSVQAEYLLALDTKKTLARGGKDTAESGDELVSAARQRLSLWDIPESEIKQLEKTRQPKKALTLYSPINGVVTQKTVVQGMRLNPGDMPYEITDLSWVWVLADAYEPDLAQIHVAMPATFTSKASGRIYQGKVAFVDPLLDAKTRTAKVRMSFPNQGDLRPETFGEVVLHSPERQAIRIPADAIVNSGVAQVVFISLGDGKLQPREVVTGASSGELIEVTRGIEVGEEVITRANFLVDSESRLKAALSGMSAEKPR